MAYYLGIDVGTSATKALLITPRGHIKAVATAEYATSRPRDTWSEQNPRHWWSAVVKAIIQAIASAEVDGKDIVAVGLTGQMHGLVVTDAAGVSLRPAIIWNDQRSAVQARQIEDQLGGRRKLIALAGNPAMTSYTLTKLLWLRDNEPQIYEKVKHLLLPKDYIRLRLTGQYAGDVTDMSGTLMLDQKHRKWSSHILGAFQIDRDILPPVFESHEVTGTVTKAAAKRLGLAEGTPVVAGAGDQQAGAVGNGVVAEGIVSASVGTSGAVLVHAKRYNPDPTGRMNTYCSAVAGQYCSFGCVLSAGGSLQWFRDVLATEELAEADRKSVDVYKLLDRQASRVPPGCGGLFWLPYLTGERTPHADPSARACWIGIARETTKAHMVRAMMEGVTFAMNDAVELLRERGARVREIRLSGGGAGSRFWRQIQADVYGIKCVTVNSQQGPAFGAALIAAVGTGRFKNLSEACKAMVRPTRTITPTPAARRIYAKCYRQYRRLYPALKGEFARIAELAATD